MRDRADLERCSALLRHCLPGGVSQSYSLARRASKDVEFTRVGEGLVDLLAYCLMNNHLHILIKENVEGGTSLYMQRLLVSYVKYYNLRYKRSGPLFIGRFRAVLVNGDEQLLHVSRYIHLNPYVAHIINNPFDYSWSSLGNYVDVSTKNTCHTDLIGEMMNRKSYRAYIKDGAGYARTIGDIKHLLLDYDG